MSSNVKIIAGLLGCMALALLWFGRGGESTAPTETRSRDTVSKSAFEKPKRKMLLDQPVVHSDLEGTDSRRSGMVKERLDTRTKKVKERRLALKEKLEPTPSAADEQENFEHWRDVALNDPDPDERADALSELDYDDDGEAMAVLVQALRDQDPEVRLSALDELWVNTDEPPLDILGQVLDDPEAEVRAEAVRMIAESEDPGAAHLLESVLGDPDEDVRDEAADALDIDEDDLAPQ